jgi:hypothetical protein
MGSDAWSASGGPFLTCLCACGGGGQGRREREGFKDYERVIGQLRAECEKLEDTAQAKGEELRAVRKELATWRARWAWDLDDEEEISLRPVCMGGPCEHRIFPHWLYLVLSGVRSVIMSCCCRIESVPGL